LGLGSEEILDIFGGALIAAHEAAASKAGKSRWADKDPENVLYLEEWQRLLPGGFFFVHVVRHPLDTLASLLEVGFRKTVPPSFEEKVESLKRFVQAGADYEERYPATSLRIRYEDMVTEPEATLANLFNGLSLRWESEVLEKFNLPQRGSGVEDPKVSATRNVHDFSVGRWRRDLTRKEVATALRILGADEFQGYPLPAFQRSRWSRWRLLFHNNPD
jgi:hypothetical protein